MPHTKFQLKQQPLGSAPKVPEVGIYQSGTGKGPKGTLCPRILISHKQTHLTHFLQSTTKERSGCCNHVRSMAAIIFICMQDLGYVFFFKAHLICLAVMEEKRCCERTH